LKECRGKRTHWEIMTSCTPARRLAGAFFLALLCLLSPFSSVLGQDSQDLRKEAAVHITVFTSPECPECVYVRERIIPQLEERYGASLLVTYLNADEGVNYDLLAALEREHGDTDNQLPVIFCGTEVLAGRQEVTAGLADAIATCLQKGGCPPVQLEKKPERGPQPSGKAVHLAYFYSTGCQKCGRVERMLSALRRQYNSLSVQEFDLSLAENKILAEALGKRCGLSEDRRLTTPSLFIGQHVLVGGEISQARVQALVEEYLASGAEPIWVLASADTSGAYQGIIKRFQALSVLTVMFAGLIDGINPCAFASIVFLISYLALVGRQRREVLFVGITFTSAVFLTYLTMGLGLFQFLRRIVFLEILSRLIYGLTAILVFVLGIVSLYDYVQVRKGHKPSEMKLQLPMFLKRRIHATIREQSKSGRLLAGAFLAGVTISLLELACTGQVYLPTIVFVTGVSGLRAHAFFYLTLYNLLFVLPLTVVFLVSYMGVTSQQMGALMEAHIGRVKLILGLFFLFLSGILVYVQLS
jgi:glutaredoxin